jgi:hypothetical protein
MWTVQRAVVALLDLSKVDVELEVDALGHRDLQQPVAHLLVIAAQDHVGAVDQRHMAAELVEDAGELVGDIAAAGDHDPLRQLLEVEHSFELIACSMPLDLGHDRPRAGGDQDLVGGDRPPARQPHLVGPVSVARSWKISTLWLVSVSV